ncbi:MAG: S46 family peptidase [Polyangiaceae bacterium]
MKTRLGFGLHSSALVPIVLVSFAAGCGGETPVAATPAAPVTPAASATLAVTEAPKLLPMPPASTYENPGGMWMPHQMAGKAKELEALGLKIDPKFLADPLSPVLGAVISLGGCSASFISPEGLIATNHHCATGALQFNSTPEADLLKNGYLAKTRADERSNGPTARVFVTRAVTDVTKEVRDGLDATKDDAKRWKTIENREKEIVARCEKDKPGTRCNVSTFFEGASYYLVEQLEIRDVRLVYAPHRGVGNYGGEVDNWRWPRHTGDVSLFRAYVGKDGKPADYAKDNVPFVPAHYLKVAKEPLKQGDLVFVAGYPGRTNLLKTAGEVDEAVSYGYPRRQEMLQAYITLLEELGKTDKDLQLKATPMVRGFANGLTNTKGQLEGLGKGGLLAKKKEKEKALRAFVDGNQELAKKSERKIAGETIGWGNVLDKLATEMKEKAKTREQAAQNGELSLSRMLGVASVIVRMAEERPKADKDRDPEYQERNFTRFEQNFASFDKRFHEKMDKEVMKLALSRALTRDPKDRTPAIDVVLGKKATSEAIPAAVDAFYKGTKLGDAATRLDLLKKATTKDLQASKDTFIQLALKLRPLVKAEEDRDDKFAGRMAVLKPVYFEALKAFEGKDIAPDANGTLRVTFGTVKGYAPKADAKAFTPFTVLPEVLAKNTNQEPFDAPAGLVKAFEQKKFGKYVDPYLGQVPVDFLSDLHITGGNSGSATFNAKGELVGLAFDGNYESLASDWYFMPQVTRSIHVDIRYVEWLLDAVDGGDAIVKEMGGTPSVD